MTFEKAYIFINPLIENIKVTGKYHQIIVAFLENQNFKLALRRKISICSKNVIFTNIIKFKHCKKAKKFESIFQFFVAFSEYLNFIINVLDPDTEIKYFTYTFSHFDDSAFMPKSLVIYIIHSCPFELSLIEIHFPYP